MDKETEGYFIKDLMTRFDRIGRMLKWLVIKQLMEDRGKLSGLAYRPTSMAQQINEQAQEIPDISDILEEK